MLFLQNKIQCLFTSLKERVLTANLLLPRYQLVIFTWSNVSEIDQEKGIIEIKPSGVAYENMAVDDIVIVDMDKKIEGILNPSNSTDTHLELYKAFEQIGGVIHTPSRKATIWSLAGLDIHALGTTTHAYYFYGDILCMRTLTPNDIVNDYELNTGKVIVEKFTKHTIDPMMVSSVLIFGHCSFA